MYGHSQYALISTLFFLKSSLTPHVHDDGLNVLLLVSITTPHGDDHDHHVHDYGRVLPFYDQFSFG